MGQGRSSLDAVWRHSVEAERATGDKVCWASLLWGLKQFYEHIGHQELIKQGIISGFPMHVLIYTLSTYKWKIILLLDGAYSQPLYTNRGIVAGSTSATYEAKAFIWNAIMHGGGSP
eukprot:2247570-Pyramimonas_sp.AAC.1